MQIEARLKLMDQKLERAIKFHQQNQNDPHQVGNAVITALAEVRSGLRAALLESDGPPCGESQSNGSR